MALPGAKSRKTAAQNRVKSPQLRGIPRKTAVLFTRALPPFLSSSSSYSSVPSLSSYSSSFPLSSSFPSFPLPPPPPPPPPPPLSLSLSLSLLAVPQATYTVDDATLALPTLTCSGGDSRQQRVVEGDSPSEGTLMECVAETPLGTALSEAILLVPGGKESERERGGVVVDIFSLPALLYTCNCVPHFFFSFRFLPTLPLFRLLCSICTGTAPTGPCKSICGLFHGKKFFCSTHG